MSDSNTSITPTNWRYAPLKIRTSSVTYPHFPFLQVCFFHRKQFEDELTRYVATRIENSRLVLQHLPAQDEVDAWTELGSTVLYVQRVGWPVGVLAGTYSSYSQAKKSSWYHAYIDGIKDEPRQPLGPARWLSNINRVAQAFGTHWRADQSAAKQTAALAGGRVFFWGLAAAFFTQTLVNYKEVYATTTDVRFKDFCEAFKKRYKDVGTKQMKEEVAAARRRAAAQQRPQPAEADQASPVGGGTAHDSWESSSEEHARESSPSQSADAPYSGWKRWSFVKRMDEPYEPLSKPDASKDDESSASRDSGKTFLDDDDDASPVAAEYRDEPTSVGGSRSTFKSGAWDRIRAENGTRTSNPQYSTVSRRDTWIKPSPSSAKANAGDNADSVSEREKAQDQFDRLLEAERNASAEPNERKAWERW